MEYIDIVDDQDNVIGTDRKDICQAAGYKHRGAGLLIFRDATYQELLLQKRSRFVRNAGRWCSPGGHVLTGETYERAARRELGEELFADGVAAPLVKPEQLFKFYKDEPTDREFIVVHRIIHPGPFFPDPQEVADLRFSSLAQIRRELSQQPAQFTLAFHHIFGRYLVFINSG